MLPKEAFMSDPAGCARPTGASVSVNQVQPETSSQPKVEEVYMVQAKVGKPAPDFSAPTYHQGTFSSIKLADYLGNWTMLCFYPGDFTFV
jgi:peroxiredoxin (alkyl hydroperoxide reductase subunit C)